MSEDEARDVITAIIGPVDRPWDTRWRAALEWAKPSERRAVIQAGVVLGYSIDSIDA